MKSACPHFTQHTIWRTLATALQSIITNTL